MKDNLNKIADQDSATEAHSEGFYTNCVPGRLPQDDFQKAMENMKDKLSESAGLIQSAYEATEGVAASGSGLDRLAAARQMMRKAFQTLKEAGKEAGGNG